jgi:hypothetical protein
VPADNREHGDDPSEWVFLPAGGGTFMINPRVLPALRLCNASWHAARENGRSEAIDMVSGEGAASLSQEVRALVQEFQPGEYNDANEALLWGQLGGVEAALWLEGHFVQEYQAAMLKAAATTVAPGAQQHSVPWAACTGTWTTPETPLENAVFLAQAFQRGHMSIYGQLPEIGTVIPGRAGAYVSLQLQAGIVVPNARLGPDNTCRLA